MKELSYRRNHYVPEWYQKRFLDPNSREKKFYYLDLSPEPIVVNGRKIKDRDAMLRWGAKKCFVETDLYTTRFGHIESTEIEEKFFGRIDRCGQKAVEYLSDFMHPSVDPEAFQDLMVYMSTQKLRTPKGLDYLASKVRSADRNQLLFSLQRLRHMFCAIWSECVWVLADCKNTDTKLIISDHPVTVYNMGCFPKSQMAVSNGDPEIWNNGTHTYFPLSAERLLILTHVSWVRNPYANPMRNRPNPRLFRNAMFDFTSIQTHRELSELDVKKINYITKSRARRYVSASKEEWLYPERELKGIWWDSLGKEHLFMPDPRSATYSTEIAVGYADGSCLVMDEYGRSPGQKGFGPHVQERKDWESFLTFQGEYARRFGPKRRGRSYQFNRLSVDEDDPDFHLYNLSLESKSKKKKYK